MELKFYKNFYKKDCREFGAFLFLSLKDLIKSCHVNENYIIISLDKINFPEFLFWIRDFHFFSFDILVDIIVVDLLDFAISLKNTKRYEFNFLLLSKKFNKRLVIKFIIEDDADLNTLTTIYRSGGWYEREIWDFFGIGFLGHTDLRRILTDYGFKGSPLKRDFPLSGLIEIKFDDEEKRLIYEKIESKQIFNILEFLNPWKF